MRLKPTTAMKLWAAFIAFFGAQFILYHWGDKIAEWFRTHG